MTPYLSSVTVNRSGFSLAEVMVVLVIAALLITVALPAWQRHAERGWRVQGRAALVSAMLSMERHALISSSFASAPASPIPAGEWPAPVPPQPARTRYWLTATKCPGTDLTHCVELRATPTYRDDRCGTLLLRSSGEWLSLPLPGAAPVPLPEGC
ncbi:type IV pilin protein [Cupriavidus agavae]|uniref:Type IV pilus assembly protein PilE n=1 Tax=Cupriavidus agavae TaxID=1001822 RepID=A0A4Q7S6Q7_9BURK|nr:type IV pilin protein [Cupriavidus agavae]RZT41388.1 type IV pilus assembly protein PilE [Cupriavidus agavae]